MADDPLTAFDEKLAKANIYGQWTGEKLFRNTDGPQPAGEPCLWKWAEVRSLLDEAAEVMPESQTARRSLMFDNPGLPRGTTHTMAMGMQLIRPGETAWTHRHSIAALRFTIEGAANLYTVVDGEPYPMEDNDLVLTPGWTWHDHHNESDKPAIWLDALDVPLVHNLNQIFYEEPGAPAQNARDDPVGPSPLFRKTWDRGAGPERPLRYAWRDTLAQLERHAEEPGSPHDGIALEYVNGATGGSALPTIGCWIQMLPPGFQGTRHRHTSSAVYFVVGGEGATEFDDQTLDWRRHDTLAVPNWAWHRHVNRSSSEPAYLFSVNDIPILRAFGLYREEPEISQLQLDPLGPAP